MINLMDGKEGRWPAIRASILFSSILTPDAAARREEFCQDLKSLFDRLQAAFSSLTEKEMTSCGQDGVAAEVFLQIDLEKRQVVLDKLFKYCNIDFHLFTELLQTLQSHFPDCHLIVPSLQGYELAKEIRRFLGSPKLECLYLKGDADERLLMGEALREVSFEDILDDTEKHYKERGGAEKRKQELGDGSELSMYRMGPEGEEEVLWMQVRIGLPRIINPSLPQHHPAQRDQEQRHEQPAEERLHHSQKLVP